MEKRSPSLHFLRLFSFFNSSLSSLTFLIFWLPRPSSPFSFSLSVPSSFSISCAFSCLRSCHYGKKIPFSSFLAPFLLLQFFSVFFNLPYFLASTPFFTFFFPCLSLPVFPLAVLFLVCALATMEKRSPSLHFLRLFSFFNSSLSSLTFLIFWLPRPSSPFSFSLSVPSSFSISCAFSGLRSCHYGKKIPFSSFFAPFLLLQFFSVFFNLPYFLASTPFFTFFFFLVCPFQFFH